MKTTEAHNKKIAEMKLSSVFPHYITKVEKKGRSIEELYQVIEWLTGFDQNDIEKLIEEKVTFETFF